MFLTVRDRHMLQWINGHGFVTADQAAVWMDVCDRVGRRRLQRLVEGGYLQKKRFALNDPQFHWLTKKGWQASGDDLTPPKRINRVTYFHDTTLVDLAQQLVAKTKGDFVPERRLQVERWARRGRKRRWVKSHMPDGLLYIGDEKPIAIELEISLKERNRLRNIINDYAFSTKVREVWYFVTNATVRRAIERATKNRGDFRIFSYQPAACWPQRHDERVVPKGPRRQNQAWSPRPDRGRQVGWWALLRL